MFSGSNKQSIKSPSRHSSSHKHILFELTNLSSCIHPIFTEQLNLAVNSGVHPSLHVKCHHQIIHCKFNLMIVYPSPYEHLVWDYKRDNTDAINMSLLTTRILHG